MGKSRKTDKEYTKEQRLINENRQLKRQLSSLRRQLVKLDLDKYDQLKTTLEDHFSDEDPKQSRDMLDKLKQVWACQTPNCDGHLEIFTYNKLGQTYYYRLCSHAPVCKNRTSSQKYDPNQVKGIMRKTSSESEE